MVRPVQAAPAEVRPQEPATAAEARGQELAEAGDFLGAAQALSEALWLVAVDQANRGRRSSLASEAVNAYKLAFTANPIRCEVVRAGLRLAEEFLAGLRREYGDIVMATDDYVGMMRARDDLDAVRATHGCPASAPKEALAPRVSARVPPPRSEAKRAPRSVRPDRPLLIGVGVSAGVTLGLGITGLASYMAVRNPDGSAYEAIRKAAIDNGVKNDMNTDMCKVGRSVPDVADACQRWTALRTTYLVTSALAGMFAATTVVLAGVIVRDRRRSRGAQAVLQGWRRRGGTLVVDPRASGVSLAASVRF
jgi:hypothetical protein